MMLSSIEYYTRIEALHSLFNYIPTTRYISVEEMGYILDLKRTTTIAVMKEMGRIFPIEYKHTKGYRYDPKKKPFVFKSNVDKYLERMVFWDRRIEKIKREERIMRTRDTKERNKKIKTLKDTLIYKHQ